MKSKKTFTFDKFIKDIEKRENEARKKIENHQRGQEESPTRKYNKLYREAWQNRMKFRR
tara:strand:- start:42 stop:218 length:177 start_codon:yes stop_codon:yes gene_type:complete